MAKVRRMESKSISNPKSLPSQAFIIPYYCGRGKKRNWRTGNEGGDRESTSDLRGNGDIEDEEKRNDFSIPSSQPPAYCVRVAKGFSLCGQGTGKLS